LSISVVPFLTPVERITTAGVALFNTCETGDMSENAPFLGKVVIITGAASGIGRATAIRMSELGATLALADIAPISLGTDYEQNDHYIECFDIGSTRQTNDFVSNVVARYGRIHGVFNCAGVNPVPMPLEETSDAYWEKLVNTNLKGTFSMTRATIPHLAERASYVNVSSILGQRGSPQNAVYCATKFAVIGFTKAMALELGPRGIRTNAIAPGFIETPTNMQVVAGKESMMEAGNAVALRRMGSASEIADVVAFLLRGEGGSSYMNGSVVEINGGLI